MDSFNVDALLRAIDDLRAATATRFNDQNRVSTERHQENVQRLQRIEEEVKCTNGRVTRNETQIEQLQRPVSAKSVLLESLTLEKLKWYFACVGAGVGGCYWFLHFIGKLA